LRSRSTAERFSAWTNPDAPSRDHGNWLAIPRRERWDRQTANPYAGVCGRRLDVARPY
jgi:hypothetical protein